MRVVVDANVFVSALIVPDGPPAAVVRAWEMRRFVLVTSPPLVHELGGVLVRPRITRRFLEVPEIGDILLATIDEKAVFVSPTATVDVCRDPADNRVIEAAVAGASDYIVSGDRDLLDLKEHAGIPMVTPVRFLAILAVERAGQ